MTASERGSKDPALIDLVERDPRASQELFAARLASTIRRLLVKAVTSSEKSQKELAEQLGVSESAVSQVLNGDGNVRISTFAKYAKVLGYRAKVELVPIADGAAITDDHPIRTRVASGVAELGTVANTPEGPAGPHWLGAVSSDRAINGDVIEFRHTTMANHFATVSYTPSPVTEVESPTRKSRRTGVAS